MRYKMPITAVAAFAAGYAVKSLLAPSGPAELSSALEEALAKDPVRYEQVIDQTREFAHHLKAQANANPTMPGYVVFDGLRLDIQAGPQGDLAVLVNKQTQEAQAIQYINGKTAVGSYEDRFDSVKHETLQDGKKLAVKAKEEAVSLKDRAVNKLNGWYGSVSSWWSGCGPENKVEQEEQSGTSKPENVVHEDKGTARDSLKGAWDSLKGMGYDLLDMAHTVRDAVLGGSAGMRAAKDLEKMMENQNVRDN